MSIKRRLGLMAGVMAAVAASADSLAMDLTNGIGEAGYTKSPLTKKQTKARAKSKRARKARRLNRK